MDLLVLYLVVLYLLVVDLVVDQVEYLVVDLMVDLVSGGRIADGPGVGASGDGPCGRHGG